MVKIDRKKLKTEKNIKLSLLMVQSTANNQQLERENNHEGTIQNVFYGCKGWLA